MGDLERVEGQGEGDGQVVERGAGRWDWEPPEGAGSPPDLGHLTRAEAAVFLDALARGATPTGAARVAKVARSTFYLWRDRDPTFAAAWDRAHAAAVETLEHSAWNRAVHGTTEDVWYQGKKVGTKRVPSDRLMELLLKAERPDKYRERVDHTVTAVPLTPAELKAAREAGMRPEVEAAARTIAALPVIEGQASDA